MPVTTVVPAERNPKLHDESGLDASMRRFGFTEPILMDERTGRLVAGHGRLEGLARQAAAGREPPPGVQIDEDGSWRVPVVRGWSSRDDVEAQAYVVASNRLTEAGGWDEDIWRDVLHDLWAVDALEGTGYEAEDIEAMLRKAGMLDEPDAVDAAVEDTITPVWGVIIDCDDEAAQVAALETLSEQGFKVRALMGAK